MFLLPGFSQNIQINGISNYYLRVDEVQIDRVRVTDVTGGQISHFQSENKVLLIQITGGTLLTPSNFETLESRTKDSFNNTGAFEILQVDEVIPISVTEAWIVFTDVLSRTYDAGEKIQLVKFVEGETVTTTGPVTALDWNGTVGGIVAIIGTDSVKLNHSIDVSGKGFRGGAVPDEDYTGGCRYGLSPSIKDTLHFLPSQLNRSGNKGEGVITTAWPYTKGTAYALNGGGAGNGLNSGGGGGSNYAVGGDGGRQSPICSGSYPALGGWGGYGCFELYTTSNRQIIMGGGGGSGTKYPSSTPSKGGDGGGIVIIITGVLAGNGNFILSNGETTTATSGGGGGGGAGGTVLLDVTGYAGALTVNVKGGMGGNTTDDANCTGSGGGGSGGVIWHNGTTFPGTVDFIYGAGGAVGGSNCQSTLGIPGNPGSNGAKVTNLISPLTGFLFNSVRGTDTICATQTPNILTASQPKGGDGTYIFTWEQSTDNATWTDATGIDLRTYQPPALTQTMWYRRIVTSNGVFDTSRVIQIYVYPSIGNNNIYGIDTLCYNSQAKLIPGSQPTGGNNTSFIYQWQSRDGMSTWTDLGGPLTTNTPLDPGRLTSTMYYRRLVSSTPYCRDTSNTDKITVLPLITNNGFATGDTSICMNRSPGELNALTPVGGDGTYAYSWQYKLTAGNWTNVPASNVIRYAPGVLTEETLYRRIVFSGNDNACIDTGSVKTVYTMPLITNNLITGDPVQYTCYNAPAILTGSQPGNGFNSYAYQWEQSADSITWNIVTGADRDYVSPNLTSKQYFRRTVFSTPEYKECSDISDAVEVRINPLPTGDVMNIYDTVCAGEILFVKFGLSGNGPFTVTVAGENVPSQTKTDITASTDSIAFTPPSTQLFTMYAVEDDSGCFADPGGFLNATHGIVYDVPVANAGTDSEACGANYTLQAVLSVSGSSGLWTGIDVTFSDSANANSQVTAGNYDTKTLTWTETNWHCADADDVEITFHEPPVVPDAGPDQNLQFIYTTQLAAVTPVVGTGKWTVEAGAGTFDDDALPNAVISELADATTLKWTVTNGSCPEVSDIMEIMINPLEIKKGFTPNGDLKNDVFDLGAENAEWIKIKVFNSAGILVFESDNYQEGDLWDGHNMNGVELPEGTYFYLIDMKIAGKEEEVQFRSFVEILR